MRRIWPVETRFLRETGFLTALLLLFLGCGKPEVHTYPVSGSVSLDGQPLKEGTIVFTPDDKGLGPEGGKIADGQFTLKAKPGPNRVEINASRVVPGKRIPGSGLPLKENYIPDKYNKNTTLAVKVEKGENHFEFPLESDKPSKKVEPSDKPDKKSDRPKK